MDKLIEFGMWPAAAVIIAVAALGMFRQPIVSLIQRTRKIGAGDKAIDFSDSGTTERQQLQAQSNATPPAGQITYHPLGPPSAAVADIEQKVAQKLAEFNDDADTKIKRLTRGFAITMIQKDFEVYYRIIFGSQIELMLRANAGGIDDVTAQAMFDNAKNLFPSVHQSASFDQWLGFPMNANLIEKRQGTALIFTTPLGKEFLQYLVEMGLTTPKNNG
jgi:hypothetical protein